MWHRLKNLFFSIQTYTVLRPDLLARQHVNQALYHRPALNQEQWVRKFCQPVGISPAIATFVYIHLQHYSGIKFAYVIPSDRLVEDLQWVKVCWADWEIAICDDFGQTFGIDITDPFLDHSFSTVGDLMVFLNAQVLSAPSSNSDDLTC